MLSIINCVNSDFIKITALEALERMRIATNAAAQSEFLSRWWMLHVQWTFISFQLLGFGTLRKNSE